MQQKTLQEFIRFECPTCGDKFPTEHGLKVHHATVHDESLATITFHCDWCGKEQERIQSQVNDDMHNFCDESCSGKFRSENYVGEDNPQWTQSETLTCEYCNEEYHIKPSEAETSRFCSMTCKAGWQSEHAVGENASAWNGGLVQLECEQCGDRFEVKQKREDSARFCSYDCKHTWQSENVYGSNHPDWRGGYDLYHALKHSMGPASWQTIRKREKAEACERCGSRENLHLHHIVPILCGGTNDEYNLMTLCASCHRSAELYTRELLDPLFIE